MSDVEGQVSPALTANAGQRLHALDGLRGVLATVVVLHHALQFAGRGGLQQAADIAVITFFAMSGYVLARAYDGRPLAFLVRRLVRLWPVYALCVAAGYLLLGRLPPVPELFWWPILPFDRPTIVDLPDWTLYVEVWLSPFLPAMFWLAVRHRATGLAVVLAAFALILVDIRLFPVGFFALGIAATRFPLRLPQRVPAWALWLGRISYSLYLSHWVVLHACTLAFGKIGVLAGLPLSFAVAWLLWRVVEQPSIGWSRRVGAVRLAPPGHRRPGWPGGGHAYSAASPDRSA